MNRAEELQPHASSFEQRDSALHELSQPLTVLLCTLEYGSELNSPEEMRSIMKAALGECERMRKTVGNLRSLLKGATQGT